MRYTLSLISVSNIPIATDFYAYDDLGGTVLLLECINSIYLGQKMSKSLLDPVQVEEVDVHVDT